MQLIVRALSVLGLCLFLLGAMHAEDGGIIGEDGSILGADFLGENAVTNNEQPISLGEQSADKQQLQVKFLAYSQSDSGGIEEIDEDASIFESVIIYSNKITERDTLSLRLLTDIVSSASIKREHNAQFRSLQSGASGTVYLNLNAGWQHQHDNWKYKVNLGGGSEYAYTSTNFGIGAVGELNGKNTTLSVNLQSFADTVRMIRFNGVEEADEGRDSFTFEIGLTQILTPKSLLNVTAHHSSQSGFLATQFNSVFVGGIEDYEILPDSRDRDSLTLRYKQALGQDMAYELGLRYYTDDWGIDGQTLDGRFFQYAFDRSVLLEYQYRYYVQNEADYYQESFSSAQAYQTSDPDLGDFTGHMFGIKSTFKDRVIMGKKGEWDVGVNYYTKDNGLDMIWIVSGFKISF